MTKEATYTLVAIGVIVLIAIGIKRGWFKSNTAPDVSRSGSGTSESFEAIDGDLKCELNDGYGRTITITGRGPEFERLCTQRTQPIYLYGYNYYPINYWRWYRPWGWRRWHGGGGHGGGHAK